MNTSLSKRTLKKLISDSCSKTAFSFDNKIYEHKVAMGSCLAPVLANIILTEFEERISRRRNRSRNYQILSSLCG